MALTALTMDHATWQRLDRQMDAIVGWIAVLGAGGGAAAIGWMAALVARRSRPEWSCIVAGHTVRIVATQNKKAMFVDGALVVEKTTLNGSGATLAWELPQDAGPPVVVNVTVTYPRNGAAPNGAIYADGRWVGGSEREDVWSVPPGSTPTPSSAPIADARWPAAEVLLHDLRGVPRTEVAEAATRIEGALREAFGKLTQLQRAGAAHHALGGEDAALDVARAQLDAHVTELLHALLDVHRLAMEGAVAPLDHVEELVARMTAEAEVDRAMSQAPARAAAARAVKA